MPRLLGLFRAAFGEVPTSTTSRHGGQEGPAARFIEVVIAEVRTFINRVGFDDTIYGIDRRAKLSKQWHANSPEALEQMIVQGLSLPRPASEADEALGIRAEP